MEKTELHARIWPDTFVIDANLNVLIGEIRRAIDDTPQKPEFIRTVHGVGYAFCGAAVPVKDVKDVAACSGLATALFCWVVWKDRTFPLLEGDNVIGRDPRCGIWLDADGVSRRHATLRLDSANRRVALEDLGSTNGTFLASGSRARRNPLERRRSDQGRFGAAHGSPVGVGQGAGNQTNPPQDDVMGAPVASALRRTSPSG